MLRYTPAMTRHAPDLPPNHLTLSDRMTIADALLKLGRYVGLLGFLGGLAALAAMWMLGPQPHGSEQWEMLMELTRAVFMRCMFMGILLLAISGGASWWKYRQRFRGRRWFRIMMIALVIAIPAMHLWARSLMLHLREALRDDDLAGAAELWSRMGVAYTISFVVILAIAALGIMKPRLGEPNR